ncbi:hypothetical protein OROGR_030812 [Orobanche gracilis]
MVCNQDGRQARSISGSGSRSNAADDDIIFRRIELPQLPDRRFPYSLVVIDSKLYLMGGYKYIGEPRPIPVRGYEVVNLEGGKRWHHEPLSKYVNPTEHLASCKDGLICGLGRRPYILNPAGPVTTTDMPLSCDVEVPHTQGRSQGGSGRGRKGRILVRYDLEANKWDPFCVFFWGDCSIGVVLEQDSYLVTYGTRHPVKLENDKPGVWVFDIRRGEWLDEPVKGLDKALPVIPHWDPGYEFLAYGYEYDLPRLYQVGNERRLAMVWQELASDDRVNIHCHKFTLQSPTTSGTFVARQLSNKVETLDGRTSKVIGLVACTVEGNY